MARLSFLAVVVNGLPYSDLGKLDDLAVLCRDQEFADCCYQCDCAETLVGRAAMYPAAS
jgi:hypothetical protein